MRAFDKNTGEPFDTSNKERMLQNVLMPIVLDYQQVSDLLKDLIKRYENDVDRYDRAVGSKRFAANLKIEFYEKWQADDAYLIKFINLHHATLRVEKGN